MFMFSKRLQESIKSGGVRVDQKKKRAEIVIPENEDEMTGDDWVELLRVGGESREEWSDLATSLQDKVTVAAAYACSK
jgi:hypothetical protein